MNFKRENVNPKGIKTGDCVVRALARANNISWEVAYLELSDIGLRKFRMPNDKQTYETWLKQHGWIKQKMPVWYDAFGNRNRYTVKALADEYPDIKMIISVARHLTYVENGVLIDAWNCERSYVGNYWIKF